MKRSLLFAGAVLVVALAKLGSVAQLAPTSPSVQGVSTEITQTSVQSLVTLTQTPTPTRIIQPTKPSMTSPGLSNENYYKNSAGNEVHSPAYSNNGGVPSGASAICGDGTYSFSQSSRGTCSHHGGVAEWL